MGVRRLGLVVALALSACAPPPSGTTSAPPSAALPGARVQPAAPGTSKTIDVPPLIGLASADVESLFGVPRFVRRDGPAQIWQYGTDACTLNLFFYRDGAALKVRHVEFRNRSADLPPSGCENAIVSMAQPIQR